MFKSIFSCALPVHSNVAELAPVQTNSGSAVTLVRYPAHPISSTADFMHRLQLMANVPLTAETYLRFRDQLVDFRRRYIQASSAEMAAAGASTQLFDREKFTVSDFLTLKDLREYAKNYGNSLASTGSGPLISDFQIFGPIVASSLFKQHHSMDHRTSFEDVCSDLNSSEHSDTRRAHLDFCSHVVDFYEGHRGLPSSVASVLDRLREVHRRLEPRAPVAPPKNIFWQSLVQQPLDEANKQVILPPPPPANQFWNQLIKTPLDPLLRRDIAPRLDQPPLKYQPPPLKTSHSVEKSSLSAQPLRRVP